MRLIPRKLYTRFDYWELHDFGLYTHLVKKKKIVHIFLNDHCILKKYTQNKSQCVVVYVREKKRHGETMDFNSNLLNVNF